MEQSLRRDTAFDPSQTWDAPRRYYPADILDDGAVHLIRILPLDRLPGTLDPEPDKVGLDL